MADIRQKAVATADAYREGNIASLDDATTRRLIASTAMTLSRGGDCDVVNALGFAGRYRAGAGFLAEAGYVDRDRLDRAMAGYRSEWAWARTGGMAAFLQDPVNWNDGLNLETYLRSPPLQDRAFKINAEHAHARAREQGIIADDEKPGRVAGFLKAAHIVGFNSAREAMTGGRAYRDFNGVSNYDHIHDISRNRDGLDEPMKQLAAKRAQNAIVSVADDAHPQHEQFRVIRRALDAVPAFADEGDRQRAAASIMVAAAAAELGRVDHVVAGPDGTVIAINGDLRDPTHRRLSLDVVDLVAQDLGTSTAQLAALSPQPDPVAGAQRLERGTP